MKKTKKIMSMAVAVLMAGSMLPGVMLQNVSAATATNTNAGMSNIGSVTLSNFEDFEGFGEEGVEGTTLFTGTETEQTFNLSSYLTLSIKGEGNKAEIVKDPVTNSYALKITHTGDGGNIALSNWFSTKKSNLSATATAHAGYKARFEHYAADTWLKRFNAIVDSKDWYGIARIMGFGDSLYLDGIRDFSIGLQKNYSDKYLDGEMYYNSYNKVRVITHQGQTFAHVGNNKNPMARALFNITGATGATSANYYGKGSADEPTVIWLDDIYFETIDYKVKSATVGGVFEQGEPLTNVPVTAPINVKMTDAVSDDCVSGKYITLTDSEGSAVDFTVEKDSESGFTVYPMGQKTSENYTLTVKAGMKSTINNAVTTVTDKVIKYTTCADGLAFMGYIENMSFDDLEDQSYSKKAQNDTFLDGKIQIYYNTEGDSIAVTTDPVTGSKALKFTRALKNLKVGMSKYNYVFDKAYDSGKVTVDFDVRIANDNGGTVSFISFSDDGETGTAAEWHNVLYDGYWWAESAGHQEWTRKGRYSHDAYFPATMYIDFENDKFGGTVYRNVANIYKTNENTFSNTAETHTANVKYMNFVDFRDSNVTAGATADSEIYIDNLKIAHYDYQKLAVDSISKTQEKADINGEITITMNEEVADAYVTTANFMLLDTDGNPVEGYTVSKDANKIIIKTPTDLAYETGYFVSVKSGIASAIEAVMPMENIYTFAFTTKAWSPYIYEDNFEGYEIGDKWEGPQTVKLGNASVTLEAGDSIEYALDEATGKVGFKLVKGTATGNLDFKYIFPEGFKDGKYRVYVDERIENWSKAFYCWPALLDGDGVITSARGNRMTGSYWFVQTGNYKGTDRFGFDWSEVNDSRWISGYDVNKNYKVAGELTTGTAYRIGLLDPETSETTWSIVEPATDVDTLGGVSMRINGGETDLSKAIYKGTQNNDNGVAWIYSIAVEKVALEVKGSSVESALDSFDPVGKVTVSFNDRVASSKVNNDTVKLYKADTLVEDVAVTLSDNMKNVTIEPAEGWLYNTEYKIVVDGVEGYDAVVGTAKAKTFAFKTLKKTGFEIDDIELVEGGIVTTLYNNCDDNQKFITIGVAKDATGKITEIKFGDSGYVQANSNTNIAVEFDNAAASYELYVWDGIDTMNPLVKKN